MQDRIIKIIIFVIGIESALVMVGWMFGVDALTRILPYGINMKFSTALMFFLSAIGLYYILRSIRDNDELSVLVLPGISLFIFLISAALLVAGEFRIFTGIDTLFIKQGATINAAGSGMLSIPTTINFMLFSIASVFGLFPGAMRFTLLKLCGAVIIAVGAIAVLGYATHAPALYYAFNDVSTPMAFNTALSFILLGSGLGIIGELNTRNEA